MENENPLTLEEIAHVIESISSWANVSGWYYGVNKSLRVTAYKSKFFPCSEHCEISVEERESFVELGSISGKEVLPLYKRIQELYNLHLKEKKQKSMEIRNEKLREIRGKK
ncbi:MAG: hypothetical protein PHD81_04205 [Candidatus Nanoarchaeia archaeon]|nr:hypothetical protein [Candidatus Nanoarchaeia archaeon]MDD5588285.1 hypothetical protein [Candidatus Nanoarchaeia archaeon]